MVGGTAHEHVVATLVATLPGETSHVLSGGAHVVVGTFGVFVVDARSWPGTIEVRDGVLRHNDRARGTTVADALDARAAVARLLPDLPRAFVRPVLCFAGTAPLSVISGVVVCSAATLLDVIAAAPTVLSDADVRRVALELDQRLRTASLGHVAARTRRAISVSQSR